MAGVGLLYTLLCSCATEIARPPLICCCLASILAFSRSISRSWGEIDNLHFEFRSLALDMISFYQAEGFLLNTYKKPSAEKATPLSALDTKKK